MVSEHREVIRAIEPAVADTLRLLLPLDKAWQPTDTGEPARAQDGLCRQAERYERLADRMAAMLEFRCRVYTPVECPASHMPKAAGHSWRFKTRFRRHAFGWKSQPAITRLQEALSEIRQAARLDPVLAAEGAIALLERLSPALEHVDSSSGAIGSAVNRTIAELVPIIAGAPADARTRAAWLDRLFEAHAADQIPYIEQLAEYLGRSVWIQGTRLRMGRPPDRHHASGALTR